MRRQRLGANAPPEPGSFSLRGSRDRRCAMRRRSCPPLQPFPQALPGCPAATGVDPSDEVPPPEFSALFPRSIFSDRLFLRQKPACLNGAPDVDFSRFGPFRRFLKAQNRHCAVSRRMLPGEGDATSLTRSQRASFCGQQAGQLMVALDARALHGRWRAGAGSARSLLACLLAGAVEGLPGEPATEKMGMARVTWSRLLRASAVRVDARTSSHSARFSIADKPKEP